MLATTRHNELMTTQIEAVQKSNLDTSPEYWVVCEGLEVVLPEADMTITIDGYTKVYERVKGDTYATWVVKAIITHDCGTPYHEWGVFHLVARDNGWSLGSGDYYHTKELADKCYTERGGK